MITAQLITKPVGNFLQQVIITRQRPDLKIL